MTCIDLFSSLGGFSLAAIAHAEARVLPDIIDPCASSHHTISSAVKTTP